MNYFSFHTHSSFCDGKASMNDVCQSAVKAGLCAIGFSSHAPVPFKTQWAMNFEDVLDYREEIERCRVEFGSSIKIYAALEADYIPSGRSVIFDAWRKMLDLDYIIGSVHLVLNPERPCQIWFLDGPKENYEIGLNACFDGDIKKAVTQYYLQMQEMVKLQKPDVIAHMDKVIMNNKDRFFSEKDSWYQDIVEDTLQVIKEFQTIVEVNTRGIYRGKYNTFFPNETIIKRCIELGIPLTVSVDAHHPDELKSEFESGVKTVKRLGGNSLTYFNIDSWKQLPMDSV
jgi:histidinol-phosphatase (PHP family)